MKVYSNDVPWECTYLTNGKYYETSDGFEDGCIAEIRNDCGRMNIIIIENKDGNTCAHLDFKSAWKIADDQNPN